MLSSQKNHQPGILHVCIYKAILSCIQLGWVLCLLLQTIQAQAQQTAINIEGRVYFSLQGKTAISRLTGPELEILKNNPVIVSALQVLRDNEHLYFLVPEPDSQNPSGSDSNNISFTLTTKLPQYSFGLPTVFHHWLPAETRTVQGPWEPAIMGQPVDFGQSYFRSAGDGGARHSLAEYSGHLGNNLYLVELKKSGKPDNDSSGILFSPAGKGQPGRLLMSGGEEGPGDQDHKPGKGSVVPMELFFRIVRQYIYQPYLTYLPKAGYDLSAQLFVPHFELLLQTVDEWGEVLSEQNLSDHPELYQWYRDKLEQARNALRKEWLVVQVDKNSDAALQPLTGIRVKFPEALCGGSVPGMISCMDNGRQKNGQTQSWGDYSGSAYSSTTTNSFNSEPYSQLTSGGGGGQQPTAPSLCPWCKQCVPAHEWYSHPQVCPANQGASVYQAPPYTTDHSQQTSTASAMITESMVEDIFSKLAQPMEVSITGVVGEAPPDAYIRQVAETGRSNGFRQLFDRLAPIMDSYIRDTNTMCWGELLFYFNDLLTGLLKRDLQLFQELVIRWAIQIHPGHDAADNFRQAQALLEKYRLLVVDDVDGLDENYVQDNLVRALVAMEQSNTNNARQEFRTAYDRVAAEYSALDISFEEDISSYIFNSIWVTDTFSDAAFDLDTLNYIQMPGNTLNWCSKLMKKFAVLQFSIKESQAQSLAMELAKVARSSKTLFFHKISDVLQFHLSPGLIITALLTQAREKDPVGQAALKRVEERYRFDQESWMSTIDAVGQTLSLNAANAYHYALAHLYYARMDIGGRVGLSGNTPTTPLSVLPSVGAAFQPQTVTRPGTGGVPMVIPPQQVPAVPLLPAAAGHGSQPMSETDWSAFLTVNRPGIEEALLVSGDRLETMINHLNSRQFNNAFLFSAVERYTITGMHHLHDRVTGFMNSLIHKVKSSPDQQAQEIIDLFVTRLREIDTGYYPKVRHKWESFKANGGKMPVQGNTQSGFSLGQRLVEQMEGIHYHFLADAFYGRLRNIALKHKMISPRDDRSLPERPDWPEFFKYIKRSLASLDEDKLDDDRVAQVGEFMTKAHKETDAAIPVFNEALNIITQWYGQRVEQGGKPFSVPSIVETELGDSLSAMVKAHRYLVGEHWTDVESAASLLRGYVNGATMRELLDDLITKAPKFKDVDAVEIARILVDYQDDSSPLKTILTEGILNYEKKALDQKIETLFSSEGLWRAHHFDLLKGILSRGNAEIFLEKLAQEGVLLEAEKHQLVLSISAGKYRVAAFTLLHQVKERWECMLSLAALESAYNRYTTIFKAFIK